jgi:hypothetical protein
VRLEAAAHVMGGPPILFPRLQNLSIMYVNGCDKFFYNNLRWFMSEKNIGTQYSALAKNMTNTRL